MQHTSRLSDNYKSNSSLNERTEKHPFPAFIPKNIEYLIIGSFPGKGQAELQLSEEHWFYGAKRNLFWKIIEQVYETPLQGTTQNKICL